MGIGGQMGIADNDDVWVYKSVDTKFDGTGNNNIFSLKVKN